MRGSKRGGKGKGKAVEVTLNAMPLSAATKESARAPNITWDESHVRELVNWIVTRPADRRILYNDQRTNSKAPPSD